MMTSASANLGDIVSYSLYSKLNQDAEMATDPVVTDFKKQGII